MRRFDRLFAAGVLVGVLSSAATARAAVSLSFSDGSGVLTAGTAERGGTFTVTLSLTSTTEQTTGLDYFLSAAGPASGVLRIDDRSLAGSPYSEPLNPEASVEAVAAATLNPDNDLDLGAVLANQNVPQPAGTSLVATYRFAVDPSAPLGTYTITTFSPDGQGYVGPFPFQEAAFAQQASYQVTIVPEPAGAAGVGAGMALLAARRRRAATHRS